MQATKRDDKKLVFYIDRIGSQRLCGRSGKEDGGGGNIDMLYEDQAGL